MDIGNLLAAFIGGGIVTLLYEVWRNQHADKDQTKRDDALRELFLTEIEMNVGAAKSISREVDHWITHMTWNSFYLANSSKLTVFDSPVCKKVMQFYQQIDLLRERDKEEQEEVAKYVNDKRYDVADNFRRDIGLVKKVIRTQLISLGEEIQRACL